MSNRIDSQLKALKESGRKGLITFVTAGDPDLDTTYELVLNMAKAGANLIELGIPFSDPVAEGPVIQEANVRALKNPVRIDHVFELVKRIRAQIDIPLVFLMYANSLFRYGPDKFFKKCRECGVDGVILPDLPFEEREEFLPSADSQDIRIISMVSPASGDRIGPLVSKAKGFLYCVSSLGVTGVRSEFKTNFGAFMTSIYTHSSLPAYLGFGISSPEAARELKAYCDGVIVGSAIVKLVGESQNAREAIDKVTELTISLRAALD
ncbi:MAG: tryptophan synthase subunit alpha [Clostridia bacterium]|nr:tryptophan synthase subunit alpha [Clostridia bacterium]